jgi:hypothetical protein
MKTHYTVLIDDGGKDENEVDRISNDEVEEEGNKYGRGGQTYSSSSFSTSSLEILST